MQSVVSTTIAINMGDQSNLSDDNPSEIAALERVAVAFGHDAIRPIVQGLMEELRNALVALDSGRTDTAHRVAGLAGTLGFTATSAAWEAVSVGESDRIPDARQSAERTIAAVEAWLQTNRE